jgi:predicted DNA-binding protein (MmcQ/YjbR family)
MSFDDLLDYCLSKPGAWRDEPWDGTLVSKVDQKIFAFFLFGESRVSVKCGANRLEADEWLERFPDDAAKMPYLGAQGWNSLAFDGDIPDEDLLDAIDESYHLVVSRLPKSRRPSGWDGDGLGG